MIEQDRFAARIEIANAPALDAWNEAVHAILVHGAHAGDALSRCRASDPDCAAAAAVQGLCMLLAGRAELVPAAQEAGAVAMRAADARGRAFAAALSDWLAGHALRAAARLESHAEGAPDDVLAVKLAHQIRFMAGDAEGMWKAAERALAALPGEHPGHGYLAGCTAFAREERHDHPAAERLGRAAAERNPDDMWAIHAVAHVHEMTGRAAAGERWLAATAPVWGRCGNFRFHLWWHRALFALHLGRPDAALDLYDHEVRRERSDDYRDVANAVSLLARLEFMGVGVGDRWHELAAIATRRIADDRVVFARLHYLLALLRDGRGREAAALVASLRRAALRGEGDMDRVARAPGVTLARGLQAYEAGRYAEAARLFASAAATSPRIGGSNAQRSLFARFGAEAARRSALALRVGNGEPRMRPAIA